MSKPRRLRVTVPFLKILEFFLEHPEEKYIGAEILKETKINSGTLYPLLGALVETDWLETSLEEAKIDPLSKRHRPPKVCFKMKQEAKSQARELLLDNAKKLKINTTKPIYV